MDFKGYILEPVYNKDNTIAYEQYTMTFKEE